MSEYLTTKEQNLSIKRFPRTSFELLLSFYDRDFNDLSSNVAARGEQPDSPATAADGELRGDVPLSATEGTEV